MILWRISNHVSIDGHGGLRASGRWHTRGRRIVYCAPNPATALLELLVQQELAVGELPKTYRLLKIEVPDDVSMTTVDATALPRNWRGNLTATRKLGDTWLEQGRSSLLRVPCVLVPDTYNVLLNPAHKDHRRIKIVKSTDHLFDRRLL